MTSCRCPRQAENWTQRAAEFRVPKDLYCTLSTVGLLVMSWPVVLVIVALMVVAHRPESGRLVRGYGFMPRGALRPGPRGASRHSEVSKNAPGRPVARAHLDGNLRTTWYFLASVSRLADCIDSALDAVISGRLTKGGKVG